MTHTLNTHRAIYSIAIVDLIDVVYEQNIHFRFKITIIKRRLSQETRVLAYT